MLVHAKKASQFTALFTDVLLHLYMLVLEAQAMNIVLTLMGSAHVPWLASAIQH